ncbi:hypothetical protein Bca52824_000035 [Brassica carinata]|uniref:non-specific serine/threonine protein kinase n=1 Tax=Brassica carinata TaxID=52824 RepID=A0A8X8BBA3_BRACI|nr:hypothetical protein Bca52824_000035 [Brassica carinata]
MDFAMILKATDNFTQEIGHGGFGYVYKGVLASGEEIAVKKLSEISKQGLDEFRTEVRSISRLRHINIVRLYGWSVYKEEKLLIYEYLVNGSLERHLFGGGELNWETRFHIIKGVAQGLAYIEEGGYDLILHRDLKPDNILLDRDMTPKISDFGDRPKISLVVAQLQQEKIEIQKPKGPGCYPIDEGKSGIPSSSNLKGESSTSTSCTVNRYTLSEIDAR